MQYTPVLAIHGISDKRTPDSHKGYSFELRNNVSCIGCEAGVDFKWDEYYWEAKADHKEYDEWVEKTVPVFSKQAKTVSDLLLDAPWYLAHGGEVKQDFAATVKSYPKPPVIIAHSWGTVIALHAIQDEKLKVAGLVTMGSPLNVAHNLIPFSRKPKKGTPVNIGAPWANFYYPTDIVAWDNDLYNSLYANVTNCKLNDQEFVLASHMSYWKSLTVASLVRLMIMGKVKK